MGQIIKNSFISVYYLVWILITAVSFVFVFISGKQLLLQRLSLKLSIWCHRAWLVASILTCFF